jgi:hypothetical protein
MKLYNPGGWDKVLDFDGTVDKIQDDIDKMNKEIAKIYMDTLADSLDFDRFTLEEISNIPELKDFNLDRYNEILDEINDLALKAKEGYADTAEGRVEKAADLKTLTDLMSEDKIWEVGQDYADAIDMMNNALEDSTDNIKEWNDSFKTDIELTKDMATDLGISELASTQEQLDSLFESLSGGIDGLTESELEFLEANQAVIDARDEIIAGDLEDTANEIIGAYNSISSYIDSLASNIYKANSDSLFESFNRSFDDMLVAISDGSDDISGITNKAIDDASSYLASFDKTTSLSRDIAFANAVVANKFTGVLDTEESTIDDLIETTKEYLGDDSDVVNWLETINSTMIDISYADFLNNKAIAEAYSQADTQSQTKSVVPNPVVVPKPPIGHPTRVTTEDVDKDTKEDSNVAIAGWMFHEEPIHHTRYLSFLGYANGGYTGNQQGVVHPKEYVLNAETTSKLGLNDSSSTGVFGNIVDKMESTNENLLGIIHELREQLSVSKDTREISNETLVKLTQIEEAS